MVSETPSQNWIWSVEHQQYYCQVLGQNGQWATSWYVGSAGQGPVATPIYPPEPVVSPQYSHSPAAASPYGSQPAPISTPSSLPVATPTYPSQPFPAATYSSHGHNTNPAQRGHRSDSVHLPNSQVPGRGQDVTGSYVPGRQHFETLDPSFYVRPATFFTVGKLFSILFTEPAGSTVTNYNDSISLVRFGEQVHTQVRRFIVVRAQREFCYACPIFTYGGQATTKSGVRPEEHAIAYSQSRQPMLVPGEAPLSNQPICIVDAPGASHLDQASRIYFGIHHPIQYNVKVKELGYVRNDCIQRLRGYWNMVNRDATNQDKEVTAAAEQETDYEFVEN